MVVMMMMQWVVVLAHQKIAMLQEGGTLFLNLEFYPIVWKLLCNKQLLNEDEYMSIWYINYRELSRTRDISTIENYQGQGLCYPLKPKLGHKVVHKQTYALIILNIVRKPNS